MPRVVGSFDWKEVFVVWTSPGDFSGQARNIVALDNMLVDEFDNDAWLDHASQFFNVPVRQTNTAMRPDFVDELWLRRPVNAIGRFSQVYPDRSDWTVRPPREF